MFQKNNGKKKNIAHNEFLQGLIQTVTYFLFVQKFLEKLAHTLSGSR